MASFPYHMYLVSSILVYFLTLQIGIVILVNTVNHKTLYVHKKRIYMLIKKGTSNAVCMREGEKMQL
jgi:hypothetical protein